MFTVKLKIINTASASQKHAATLSLVTLTNVGRFLICFYCRTLHEICKAHALQNGDYFGCSWLFLVSMYVSDSDLFSHFLLFLLLFTRLSYNVCIEIV